MSFVPLHVTSCYDFLDSSVDFDNLFLKLKNFNYRACGLTDFNTMFGYYKFHEISTKYNVKPVYGLDVRVENNTFSLFAMNENGYKNLIKLSYIASKNKESNEINIEDLQRFSSNLVAVISTKTSSIFNTTDIELLTKSLHKFDKIFSSNLFIGLEIYSSVYMDDEEFQKIKRLRDYVQKYPYTLVAFPHIQYLEKNDQIRLDILTSIKNQTTLDEKIHSEAQGDNYLKNPAELEYLYTKDEIEATNIVVEKCNFKFFQERGKLLKFSENDSKILLENLAHEGLKKLGFEGNQIYEERLNKELTVIDKMGYNDYFLIVSEYVNFAKNNDIIVGPGRGSAAGSLVAYCLNITEVDPIKYDLFFERFLNEERVSMPDIDVDFEDFRRDAVVNHLKDKYGVDRVCNICTIQTEKARGSLRDIGRVYGIEQNDIDALCKLLTNPRLNLRESYKEIESFRNKVNSDDYYLQIVSLAQKIIELPRQRGIHAAGVVLNEEPLIEGIPLIFDESIGGNVTQIEAPYLEKMGYLKMDILGLTNLTTIHLILDLIDRNRGIKLKFEDIPIEDPAIYEIINDNLTMGIFQLESAGMNNAIRKVKPTNINDIISILALFRPGPMGNIDDYADRKNHNRKIKYISKDLEEILAPTYGIIIYQEQIMQIAQKAAGFTLGKADILRRAISKKKISEMEKLKIDFVNGCINNGYSKENAKEIYELIEKFAAYGFNKSHSVAYSIITNRMAYLKAKYPQEFYIGVLASIGGNGDSKYHKYIDEIKRRNIKIKLPNINKSSNIFTIENDAMIIPFTVIKGLNTRSIEIILEERTKNGKFESVFDFILRTYEYKFSQDQLEKLIYSGCFDDFTKNRTAIINKLPVLFQKASLIYKSKGQSSLFNEPILFNENEPQNKFAIIMKEYDLIGLMISYNPLIDIAKFNKLNHSYPLNKVKPNTLSCVLGWIINIKNINTKNHEQMCFATCIDSSGDIFDITILPKVFNSYAEIIVKNNILLFKGKLQNRKNSAEFVASDIKEMEKINYEETDNN